MINWLVHLFSLCPSLSTDSFETRSLSESGAHILFAGLEVSKPERVPSTPSEAEVTTHEGRATLAPRCQDPNADPHDHTASSLNLKSLGLSLQQEGLGVVLR